MRQHDARHVVAAAWWAIAPPDWSKMSAGCAPMERMRKGQLVMNAFLSTHRLGSLQMGANSVARVSPLVNRLSESTGIRSE